MLLGVYLFAICIYYTTYFIIGQSDLANQGA